MKALKKPLSLFLAFLMCFGVFAGTGVTAFAAGETMTTYMVDIPRASDPNKAGWGHPAFNFLGGWSTGAADHFSVHTQDSFTGKAIYCIEPGIGVESGEDGLVEGMTFHLYGTSLSGLPVDEYAVTDSSGVARFENVLIGSDFVLEEVDTPIRYVVLEAQSATIAWNEVTHGFLKIDFSEQQASLAGEPLDFTPKEYRTLFLFVKNPRIILTKRQILEKLWDIDGDFVDEHTLTTIISRIRKKIETDEHKYIKTAYGMGYQWIGGEQA